MGNLEFKVKKYSCQCILVLLLGSVLVVSSFGQETASGYEAEKAFNAGKNLFLSGEYTAALLFLRKAAKNGHAEAIAYLGNMYEKGLGVPQNDEVARHWYQKAAEAGEPTGMYNLGIMYFEGRGVAQDYTEAARWYRKGAEAGDPMAMFHLGYMYELGLGVEMSLGKALHWYVEAPALGDKRGENRIKKILKTQ